MAGVDVNETGFRIKPRAAEIEFARLRPEIAGVDARQRNVERAALHMQAAFRDAV